MNSSLVALASAAAFSSSKPRILALLDLLQGIGALLAFHAGSCLWGGLTSLGTECQSVQLRLHAIEHRLVFLVALLQFDVEALEDDSLGRALLGTKLRLDQLLVRLQLRLAPGLDVGDLVFEVLELRDGKGKPLCELAGGRDGAVVVVVDNLNESFPPISTRMR